MTQHTTPRNLICRSLLCAIGLSGATSVFAEKTDTTQDIENFFNNRAETLQKHLSVPLSDQAFHKRFIEAYQPLNEGKIPSQWREALIQRMLALAGVDASQLSAAQQAQIANSLNILGTAGSTSEQSAAALAALGGALGISPESASNALAGAAGDASLFNGNTSVSQSFLNNNRAGMDSIINQGSNPNSLAVAQIIPPEEMKFDSEGAAVGIAASKLPNPKTLTMGNYAQQMGKPATAQAAGSPASAGVATSKAKATHTDPTQTMLAQGLGTAAKAVQSNLGNNSGGSASSGSSNWGNSGSTHTTTPSLSNNVMKNQVQTVKKAEAVVPAVATDTDPFKFDPQVLLGGDYLEQYRKRIELVTQQGSSGHSTSGSGSGASAGSSLSASAWKKQITDMGDSCEKDLHEMYGFKQGQVPNNLSYQQITEMWKKHSLKKYEIREKLYDRQAMEEAAAKARAATNAKDPGAPEGSNLFRLIKAQEWVNAKGWDPMNPIATAGEAIDTKQMQDHLKNSKTPQATFNQVADGLLSTFASHMNGLANTDQDACPMVGKQMGNPSKGECGKEFAVSSTDKNGTFRNSTLTNHVKIISFLDSIRELNSVEAESVHETLKANNEQYTKRFGDSRKGTSLTKIVLMRDDSSPTEPQAAPSTSKATGPTPPSPAETGYRPRHRRSFNLQEYLYNCANPDTSWMAKIQDLEILARRSLIKSCPAKAEEAAAFLPGVDFQDTSIPIYPSTSDICTSPRPELKTKFKAPTDQSYPDFFNSKNQLTDTQCRNLNKTLQSMIQILKVGNYKCLEKFDKRPERKNITGQEHSQNQPQETK